MEEVIQKLFFHRRDGEVALAQAPSQQSLALGGELGQA